MGAAWGTPFWVQFTSEPLESGRFPGSCRVRWGTTDVLRPRGQVAVPARTFPRFHSTARDFEHGAARGAASPAWPPSSTEPTWVAKDPRGTTSVLLGFRVSGVRVVGPGGGAVWRTERPEVKAGPGHRRRACSGVTRHPLPTSGWTARALAAAVYGGKGESCHSCASSRRGSRVMGWLTTTSWAGSARWSSSFLTLLQRGSWYFWVDNQGNAHSGCMLIVLVCLLDLLLYMEVLSYW